MLAHLKIWTVQLIFEFNIIYYNVGNMVYVSQNPTENMGNMLYGNMGNMVKSCRKYGMDLSCGRRYQLSPFLFIKEVE